MAIAYDRAMPPPFGTELKYWRQARGVSQLDLANDAHVSQRHISFLETGRSKPSREMVLHLTNTLDVPPREQNILLTAAGHAPAYPETPIEDLDAVSDALDHMLAAHEPFMAIVLDRQWDILAANDASARFTASLFGEMPSWLTPPLNIMRLTFHPDGLRPHMIGWDATASSLLRRLERDVVTFPSDDRLRRLLDEVRAYPDVSELESGSPAATAQDVILPTTYRVCGETVSLLTTIARIGDAHDLTVAELRIETFWPADERSREMWIRCFGGGSRAADRD